MNASTSKAILIRMWFCCTDGYVMKRPTLAAACRCDCRQLHETAVNVCMVGADHMTDADTTWWFLASCWLCQAGTACSIFIVR